MRLFFAAFPDPETRRRIASVAHALDLAPARRVVPPENYHMTLAFVGEVPESQARRVAQDRRAQRARAFTVRFDAYEYWPKAKVVVAAAREYPVLAGAVVANSFMPTLAQHELALAPQPLRPHVTLARKVTQAPVLQAMSAFDWTVRDIQSDAFGHEPALESVYTVVDTWPLLDKARTLDKLCNFDAYEMSGRAPNMK